MLTRSIYDSSMVWAMQARPRHVIPLKNGRIIIDKMTKRTTVNESQVRTDYVCFRPRRTAGSRHPQMHRVVSALLNSGRKNGREY